MKKIRRFAAMVAAMALAAVMVAPSAAFAVDDSAPAVTTSITIQNIGNIAHTFEVYQVMTGTKNENGSFTGLKWGSGVSTYNGATVSEGADVSDAVLVALSAENFDATTLVTGNNPLLVLSETKTTKESSGDSLEINGLAPGYYVIKDVTNLTDKDDANSAWIVQVAGPTEIVIKKSKPEVDKTVYDNDDGTYKGTGTDNNGFFESADHAIGEKFQFKLVATIPADNDLKFYETYALTFHDQMSDGLTFDKIDSVKIGDTTLTTYTTAGVQTGDAGKSWTLAIADIKAPAGDAWGTSEITVEVLYTAHLNENAIISEANGTGLNVNKNTVLLEYSNNPDHTGAGDTGKTEEDHVWVFTYKVDNTKYKINNYEEGNELDGAKFTLHKDSKDGAVIGVTWNEAKSAYVVNGTTEGTMESGKGGTGKFNIIGLDAGKYCLVEDEAPKDYNVADPVTFEITAAHSENADTVSADLTLQQTNNGRNEIVDTKNSTLPSTGGIGTKLFVVGGGLAAAMAGVYLVSKKKAKDESAE